MVRCIQLAKANHQAGNTASSFPRWLAFANYDIETGADRLLHPLDRALALHCSPALAGIKAGNLVSLNRSAIPELDGRLDAYRQTLAQCGIAFEILCDCEQRALLLVYRPALLACSLARPEARRILSEAGYPDGGVEELLTHLKRRLAGRQEFPQEIGLFLDYPPADVEGFLRWGGRGCKLCGHWKVYSDVEGASRLFRKYDRCREILCRRLSHGLTIPQVLLAAS